MIGKVISVDDLVTADGVGQSYLQIRIERAIVDPLVPIPIQQIQPNIANNLGESWGVPEKENVGGEVHGHFSYFVKLLKDDEAKRGDIGKGLRGGFQKEVESKGGKAEPPNNHETYGIELSRFRISLDNEDA
ncbi:hypothetical protein GOBAR_DD12009 [Gossypium barbadense]|nr:hypothetical protein GOBAR_DD12009 [Gossypium barbadense]